MAVGIYSDLWIIQVWPGWVSGDWRTIKNRVLWRRTGWRGRPWKFQTRTIADSPCLSMFVETKNVPTNIDATKNSTSSILFQGVVSQKHWPFPGIPGCAPSLTRGLAQRAPPREQSERKSVAGHEMFFSRSKSQFSGPYFRYTWCFFSDLYGWWNMNQNILEQHISWKYGSQFFSHTFMQTSCSLRKSNGSREKLQGSHIFGGGHALPFRFSQQDQPIEASSNAQIAAVGWSPEVHV